MSAQLQPKPIEFSRGNNFLIIPQEISYQLMAITTGKAMYVLLHRIFDEARLLSKRGAIDGYTGVLRCRDIGSPARLDPKSVGEQIRICIKWKLIERIDAATALTQGIISQAEYAAKPDGHVYRALLKNWAEKASALVQEWEEEQAEARRAARAERAADREAAQKPAKAVKEAAQAMQTQTAAAPAPPVIVPGEPAQPFNPVTRITSIQCRSELPDSIVIIPTMEDGVLTIEARLANNPDPGKYICRPDEVPDPEVVKSQLRDMLRPIFKKLSLGAVNDRLLTQIAVTLQSCPVLLPEGQNKYYIHYERAVAIRLKKGGKIEPGLFVLIAEDAREDWLEMRESQETSRATVSAEHTERERKMAKAFLEADPNEGMITEADRKWARGVLGL